MQEGRTPLHYAAMCPELDKAMNCYELMLAYGAPENAKDAVKIAGILSNRYISIYFFPDG
jgi:ankyrin repeat protein